jgi:hypothetical protein
MQGRRVFVTPQAARREVDDLLAAVAEWQFETQTEIDTDHHRQLADEHQPVLGHVAQKTDGFVGDAVVHPQEVRQLVPFNSTIGKHAQYAMQGSITEPHLCFGTCLPCRRALPASGVTVANTPSPQPLPVAGVAPAQNQALNRITGL